MRTIARLRRVLGEHCRTLATSESHLVANDPPDDDEQKSYCHASEVHGEGSHQVVIASPAPVSSRLPAALESGRPGGRFGPARTGRVAQPAIDRRAIRRLVGEGGVSVPLRSTEKRQETDYLSPGRGSRFRPPGQRLGQACRPFQPMDVGAVLVSRVRRRRETSPCVASTVNVPATYPRVVRAGDNKCLFAGISYKPSDGLEPSTPSLPWRCSTN
jgi:hypothetical protein